MNSRQIKVKSLVDKIVGAAKMEIGDWRERVDQYEQELMELAKCDCIDEKEESDTL